MSIFPDIIAKIIRIKKRSTITNDFSELLSIQFADLVASLALGLNARVTKVQFYQRSGFEPIGEVFASSSTGVPHIKMQKEISR